MFGVHNIDKKASVSDSKNPKRLLFAGISFKLNLPNRLQLLLKMK